MLYYSIVCICQYGIGPSMVGGRLPVWALHSTPAYLLPIASRIGSAVLTAPIQVFQGIRNDYYTHLLFYTHKQTTMVMLFTL